MRTLLISAVACLALSLFSFSQDENLLWLEGKITQSDRDSVTCDIYMYNWKTDEWGYMITYNYADTYAMSFDYPEYYALVFKDSDSRYVLHVAVKGKSFEIVNIGLDADVKVLLHSTEEKPSDYVVELMD